VRDSTTGRDADMDQKNTFLESEGNEWFRRNIDNLHSRELPHGDAILVEVLKLLPPRAEGTTVLEIGCADGTRLKWLQENRGCRCYGVDPSAEAVAVARAGGIDAHQATADQLPFKDCTFDIVIFGFCLYLCDDKDLFRIALEADRVLRNPGWLVILDFYSPTPLKRAYRHREGLFSRKMDYRTLFTWHPGYIAMTHHVRRYSDDSYTDDRQEWIATSVIRKNLDEQ